MNETMNCPVCEEAGCSKIPPTEADPFPWPSYNCAMSSLRLFMHCQVVNSSEEAGKFPRAAISARSWFSFYSMLERLIAHQPAFRTDRSPFRNVLRCPTSFRS